ncbi:uncharacterized protein LOC142974872 [Anticarsia gemmatalis]|uniref:uncharacterized protein LOC142974872 n=1 Tax=Anticarsia gemmatalis TaxID=129554 RepID=UPI003F763275
MVSFEMQRIVIVLATTAWLATAIDLPPSCNRSVYCNSKLLHHVQTTRVFADSKTFVDLEMKYDENKTLTDFDSYLNETGPNPTKSQMEHFVNLYFSNVGELEEWTPTDYTTDPEFVNKISDKTLRQFGKDINEIWPIISRKVKDVVFEKPDQFSLVPLRHGFIIPGGRFKEIYYWDTYWIIEGLLISGMQVTAKGMIENLIDLLNIFGHIPNGSRYYYQERSQPPMLAAMMAIYYKYTNDIEFIRDNIASLEKEVDYWLDSRTISVQKGNTNYTLLRYYAPSSGPRPESYNEDYIESQKLDESEREDFYIDMKSAAESGWDFSSRWFITSDGSNAGELINIHTRYIVPVDLNAIFAGVLQNLADFHSILMKPQKAAVYGSKAELWREAIQAVLWNEDEGVWFDYNLMNNQHRRYFYTSNVAPLWMGAVSDELIKLNGPRVVSYLRNSTALEFIGGIPTSLNDTGEQWDFPNVWPPEVSIIVNALAAIKTDDAKDLALEVAQTFVRACHTGFTKYQQMFEKYQAESPGESGRGGEYTVQIGFGWSNGAVLEFLSKYGDVMTAYDSSSGSKNYKDGSQWVYCADIRTESQMLKILSSRFVPLYPVLGLLGACAQAVNIVSVCNSSVYCSGELLRTVQLARVFPDSKTFVDLKLVHSQDETVVNFKKLIKETNNRPTRLQIANFVTQNFEDKDELFNWRPPDFDPTPPVLEQITDPKYRQFAKDIIGIWPELGRIVSHDVYLNPDQYSFIYVPNGFIVPGGRFKELYYWDSYWIIRGLLISNMTKTAKGMIENFLHIVNTLGYIPNGSRIYYLGRSQPPLLTWMVHDYMKSTGDIAWLEKHIATVEQELKYWLLKKTVVVKMNGKKHMLLRYASDKDDKGPRPESYFEDYSSSRSLPDDKQEKFYMEIKSAAESGWDFSSRWFVTAGNETKFNLTDINASRILPVDLNSIFAGALQMVGDLRRLTGDYAKAQKWWYLAKSWRNAIDDVMWDAQDGTWYDYDILAKLSRKHFYPSCATPLWAGAVESSRLEEYAPLFVKYLVSSGALKFPGGVPTSLWNTGEQWDFPNAWPPLQSILIGGLERSGNDEAKQLARKLSDVWVRANYVGYTNWKKMFEKYSCEKPGDHGGGGEYAVQNGFGWTNGIVLELLQRYGKELRVIQDDDSPPSVQVV